MAKLRRLGYEIFCGQSDSADSERQRPASPTKFSSQAVDSPSKMNVPSRRQRNQPANRVHDIEFVTDISTSLLAQVRQLQGVLAERDEAIKALSGEKSQLEHESRGLAQRLKTLDESEQRYKDENWSLETQTHDLMAAANDHASREQKLQQGLAAALAEKTSAQRELDEAKQALGKLGEDHTSLRKHHESELTSLRKNMTSAESNRDDLQKKVEELSSQNEELAKAVAGRYKSENGVVVNEIPSDPEDLSLERSDLDHSPPPSPQKNPARNTVLESETLKSSLHHAHRMIQSLKTGITRQKTENSELNRLLKESRDELEACRNDHSGSSTSRSNKAKAQQSALRKLPKQGQLGATRSGRLYIEEDDPEWEEHNGTRTVRPSSGSRSIGKAVPGNASQAYQTAAETDAFETANERENSTETDAFQTGAESLADESSGEVTEKETDPTKATPMRGSRVPSLLANKRQSYLSTASTSDEDLGVENVTPRELAGKYNIKTGRGNRRLRMEGQRFDSSPLTARDSPASGAGTGTPQAPGQSLFAELGDLGGEGSDDEVDGTPSKVRGTTISPESVRVARGTSVQAPKVPYSDTGMMTEPWEPPTLMPSTMASVVGATLPKVAHQTDSTDQRHAPSDASTSKALPANPSAQVTPASIPQLGFSEIASIAIAPSKPTPRDDHEPRSPTAIAQDRQPTPTALKNKKEAAGAGIIGSVIGWAAGRKTSAAEPISDEDSRGMSDEGFDFEPSRTRAQLHLPLRKEATATEMADQSSQTALSAAEIEQMLMGNDERAATVAAPATYTPTKPRSASASVARDSPQLATLQSMRAGPGKDQPATRAVRRPNSSAGVRTSSDEMPPLPAHHQQAIAAAQQTPSKQRIESVMGPPLMPAWAYRTPGRRPQTPQEQNKQTPGSATPRARYSTARSMRSRRSSVSSFESELDARFNIRPDGMPMVRGMDSSTDPRMIQAITQTMIGEYLWKYTRKAGRGEMSDKRHRRFFWVHPYTRTLYWSNQDPSQAGRAQLKAKSVAIEAVRVVVDDNPMPPGLHRKSLLVITPGRDVKFTASTGQRHETWFNALSYLLLRSGPEPANPGLTPEEMAEFNPAVTNNNTVRGSRISLASYQSRRSTAGVPARSHSRASSRDPSPSKAASVRGNIPAMPHANSGSTTSRYSQTRSSISSRLSNYWRPGGDVARQSSSRLSTHGLAGRHSRVSGSVYNAGNANDSAEDVRQVLEKQDQEADRLENVRACCDGETRICDAWWNETLT